MDAIIRFCFLIDAEKIESFEEYGKIYGQAKYCWDTLSLMEAKKAIGMMK